MTQEDKPVKFAALNRLTKLHRELGLPGRVQRTPQGAFILVQPLAGNETDAAVALRRLAQQQEEHAMPPLTLDERNPNVDPWECPVYSHNANTIQRELNAVMERARRAGVQLEFHRSEGGTTVEAVGLEVPSDDDRDGVFLVASPDPDIEPELVL